MMVLSPNFVFRNRESAARLSALFVGILIIVGQTTMVIFPQQSRREEPIRINFEEMPKPPVPRRHPDPPKPQPRKVTRKVQTRKVVVPVRKQVAEMPVPAVAPHVVSVPTPTNHVAAPAPYAAKPRVVSNGESEANFAKSVREKIEANKVYPAEAQSLGMTGTVTLRYVIDRSGKLLEVEVTSSSGSKLLDQAALQAVRKTIFQPIPEDAWVGEAKKAFMTKIIFELDG